MQYVEDHGSVTNYTFKPIIRASLDMSWEYGCVVNMVHEDGDTEYVTTEWCQWLMACPTEEVARLKAIEKTIQVRDRYSNTIKSMYKNLVSKKELEEMAYFLFPLED